MKSIKVLKFSDSEKGFVLERAETTVSIAEMFCRESISGPTFPNRKRKYSGIPPNKMRWHKQFEEKDRVLKSTVAHRCLEK